MKIFVHALYAKPKRSNEELRTLHTTLQAVSPKSLDSIANMMIKFSYNDLSKEYKSCLLYLAIFPRRTKIKRSTLIGRWVVEGLVTTADWGWPNSVDKSERCFDTLINRWLIYPCDIGATGEVKSCMVHDRVHEFITKIAKKQRIVETRLSHHLAHHFSIFNDLRLRRSDKIETFLENLSKSYQSSLLKVLDLEGCLCFGGKKRRYLRVICNKMLLLKYLSLRRTDAAQLPSEINNLHELEVLDIRQTMVPASATRDVRLLKLKRLLFSLMDPSPDTSTAEKFSTTVEIPEKIEKMLHMEVLSNVRPRITQDLSDLGALCQLRKLGVVIQDKTSHLNSLLEAIGDLHECLRSLSITLVPKIKRKAATFSIRLPNKDLQPPKVNLESLSISGTTEKKELLQLLAQGDKLAKVTLSSRSLNQKDMKLLAEHPTLSCVKLRQITCTERMLTFKKEDFKNLKYFFVEGSNLTEISFEDGAPRDLEKIVLSLSDCLNLCCNGNLSNLQELELNNNNNKSSATTTITTTTATTITNNNNSVLFPLLHNAKQISKVTLRGTLLNQDELKILGKMRNIRCLALLDKSYEESELTFSKDEFPNLNHLTVECSDITKIKFNVGSSPKLEKFVWTFINMESLLGIDGLRKLKEVELKGDIVLEEVEEAINKHKGRFF